MKTLIAIPFGLWLLHRACLWMESRGWLYYKTKSRDSSGSGNALEEFNALLQPSTRHVIEAKQKEVDSESREKEPGH